MEIDIHTTAGKIADLGRRIDEAVNAAPAAKAITGNANIAPTRIKSCVESCAIALLTPSRNASHAPVSCGITCPRFRAFNAAIQPWPTSLAIALAKRPTSEVTLV